MVITNQEKKLVLQLKEKLETLKAEFETLKEVLRLKLEKAGLKQEIIDGVSFTVNEESLRSSVDTQKLKIS